MSDPKEIYDEFMCPGLSAKNSDLQLCIQCFKMIKKIEEVDFKSQLIIND